jgi:hypothetical protein
MHISLSDILYGGGLVWFSLQTFDALVGLVRLGVFL